MKAVIPVAGLGTCMLPATKAIPKEIGATLGANCTIVCGITIGEYAFIGAGALINKNVKSYALMVGVPAKQIGWMSPYGEQLDLPIEGDGKIACQQTRAIYQLTVSAVKSAPISA